MPGWLSAEPAEPPAGHRAGLGRGRAFCPSSGARCLADCAAQLVDRIIPRATVRQWVLALPIASRMLLAAWAELITPARETTSTQRQLSAATARRVR